MPYFNDERLRKIRVGIDSYTNQELALDVIGYSNVGGKLGIGSIPVESSPELFVDGDGYFTGVVTATTFFAGPTEITGGAFADDLTVNTLEVSGLSTFIGLGTFISDLYVGGTLYIDTIGNYVLENIDLDGIFTASQLSTGSSETSINIYQDLITGPEVITIDPTTIGDNTGAVVIKGDLYIEGEQFYVNSTTIELADFNVGIATTVGTNVLLDGAGIGIGSTNIRKTLTYDYSSDSLKSSENFDLDSGKVYKIDEVEVLSSSQLTVPNIYSSGIGTIETLDATTGTIDNLDLDTLRVSGISTFTNGPVFVGSGTSTGTADQKLQVTGGAYISSNLGIGTTNPRTKLEIDGVLGFTKKTISIGDTTTAPPNIYSLRNIFIGVGAGASNALRTSGEGNIYIGRDAGSQDIQGQRNIFIGNYAGHEANNFAEEIRIGSFAGANSSGVYSNILIGQYSGGNNSGNNNIILGENSGYDNSGDDNIIIGRLAAYNNSGYGNDFFGYNSGANNTTGAYNKFFGRYAGESNTTGSYNTFFGLNAGKSNTTGSNNTFLGNYTGLSTSASHKVILGSGVYSAGYQIFDAPDTTKNTQFAVGIRTSSAPSKYWLVGDENFNVGIGTTNPTTKLQIGGVLGFGPGNNIRIGDETTGANLTTGYDNIFMGVGAGNSTTTGYSNNFFGRNAGYKNTSGDDNNFLGSFAGFSNTDGFYNNFLGIDAGFRNTSGSNNNFFGSTAGYENTTGSYNNFFGCYAGRDNTTGSYNNFFGNSSGQKNTTGTYNNFLGSLAGFPNTTGSNNIFIGSYAGISTSASNKIIFGRGFNFSNFFDAPDTTKDTQFAVGIRTSSAASKYWLVGDENFNVGIGTTNPKVRLQIDGVLGFGTFRTSPFGSPRSNIRIGDETTGANLTTGYDNIFIGGGFGAGNKTTTGIRNIFLGPDAGRDNTDGGSNVFIGYDAGFSNTTGNSNLFVGSGAGYASTTGEYNTFFGGYAGYYHYEGDNNNFFGAFAGYDANGYYNNFFGRNAGRVNRGNYNNFFGGYAGWQNTFGNYNNSFGTGSGSRNTTGTHNNFFGYYSGSRNTTGSNNIFFGSNTGASTIASNKIIFGRGFNFNNLFDAPNTTKDTQLAIGIRTSSAPSKYWLVGDENFNVGIGTTNPTSKLTVGGDAIITGNLNVGVGGTIITTTGIGSVGIGSTQPTEALEVAGNVKATEFIGIGSQLTNITFRQLSDVDGSNLVPVGAGTTTPDYLVIYDPNTDSFRFVDPKTYFGINNDFNPDPIIVDYGSY